MGHPVREIGQGGGDGVDAEPASSESVTESSSEASWRGASSESENWYLVRGLLGGASGEAENRYLVRGLSDGASGEAENWYLVQGLARQGLGRGGLGRGEELVPRPRPCGVGLGRIGESAEASWLSLGFDIYKV